jgi:hypothetical protein
LVDGSPIFYDEIARQKGQLQLANYTKNCFSCHAMAIFALTGERQ